MEEKRKPGRPRTGKRSDRTFCQVCGYVKITTYKEVKKILIDEEMEFSELMQQLLDEWVLLKRNGKNKPKG